VTTGEAKALTAFFAGGEISNSVFREMMEVLPVAIYTTDDKGRLTYFNPAAIKLSGRVPELGTDMWCVTWKIFLPDGTPLPHDQCPMAVALKGVEVPTGIECVAERPDGTRFWFTPCPAIVRDTQGRIVGGINLLVDITDRKNAEIEAREQFRAIVETTPECVKIVARDGTLLFMNPSGLELVEAASADAVLGRSVYELIAPEDRERYREFNERVCRGEKGALQFDVVGLQGRWRQMETHAAPLRQTDGTILQLAITRDISERKQAERASLLLSAIVDSSDDAIISKDLNGVITSWNQSAERVFGYTAAEAVGQPVTLLIPSDRLEEESIILTRLQSGARVDHFETVRRRKDGQLIDVSITVWPIKNANGDIVGASKVARDISEVKRVHAALLASEARFRQLADAMPQIVWTALPDGSLDYYNDRWYEFTGMDRNGFKKTSWESVVHPEDIQGYREAWSGAVRSGSSLKIEYRFWDVQENRWRWFMGRALPIRDADGKIVKWFGSSVDIDDQKRVQEDLRRANEDLEQFAFSASHDLQEPLRSVKIYSELLVKRYAGGLDDEAREFMRYLRNGATRMEALVHDLLTYTQATKFEKPTDAANANDALEIALSSLAGAIAETGAEIHANRLPSSIPVHGTHLQQLFQNLVGNAIKYHTPQMPPLVYITAERENGHWVFAVRDNGIGIAPEYQQNIFGLFKRLHTTDEYAGTGIGLAICQRIVDRYQGRIWVESEPGCGSTFRFTLPL
jgi:PAS domain S-box-containing protein